jgi:hypothetical protein
MEGVKLSGTEDQLRNYIDWAMAVIRRISLPSARFTYSDNVKRSQPDKLQSYLQPFKNASIRSLT